MVHLKNRPAIFAWRQRHRFNTNRDPIYCKTVCRSNIHKSLSENRDLISCGSVSARYGIRFRADNYYKYRYGSHAVGALMHCSIMRYEIIPMHAGFCSTTSRTNSTSSTSVFPKNWKALRNTPSTPFRKCLYLKLQNTPVNFYQHLKVINGQVINSI